jgi:UDP-N-acetylmuramyl pentapeptide synthase
MREGFYGIYAHAIAEAVNGKVVADGDGTMGNICIDTRNLQHGQWFLALTGRMVGLMVLCKWKVVTH